MTASSPNLTLRQSHRLLQLGILLFLLALFIGLAVPAFAVPRLALSAHLLGITQGIFLMVIGLLWPRLRFTQSISRLAFVLVVYGCVGALTANLLAGIWGAGNSILPIAAGQARGTDVQEMILTVILRSAGVSLIAAVALIAWGLRTGADQGS